jgi:sulfur-oxidizing protein SoxY
MRNPNDRLVRVVTGYRVAFALTVLIAAAAFATRPAMSEDDAWPEIRETLFASRQIVEDASVKLFAPKRAEDAALVPLTIYIAEDRVARAKQLTLVVDQNPAPVAAVFVFGEAYRSGGEIGDRTIEVRVRLESMSRVRAILESDDGALYEASQFVSGAGGCTSTSLKDVDEALAGIGKIKLKIAREPTRGQAWNEVQLMIRHPNFSGMQIDTRTNTYTPVRVVDRIDVDAGSMRLLTIESGIAISEDPNFRFTFARNDRAPLTVVARDTDGKLFRAQSEQ